MDSPEILVILFFWVFAALVVGGMGNDRKIGFGAVFLVSLLLSPIIGALIALGSERLSAGATSNISPQQRKQADNFFTTAVKKAKNNQFEEAIADLNQAISLKPNFFLAQYNLACYYSRLQKKHEAFRFLELAIQNGYKNFSQIESDQDLAFLRSQNEYPDFVANSFKKVTVLNTKDEILSNLERLAALRDKGILTEKEFHEQKKRLLEST